MKFALQKLSTGETRMVDANGNPLGNGDVDRPILHILPKLMVPAEHHNGVDCDNFSLEVTSTLPVDVIPEGGVVIRQPYPNRRYFVGGSPLIRNGWIIPLPLDVNEFDIEFRWYFEGLGLWQTLRQDTWEIRHLIHIKLHPGKGMTYSMDASCWPERNGPAMHFSPVTPLGNEEEDPTERAHRQIIRESDLVYQEVELKGELAGYFLEERVDITGIPLEQAWSIEAFQDEQLHEVKQQAVFAQENEAHRVNGHIEMPPELFVQAVKLAEEIPFDEGSEFAKSVIGIPGGMERHPAMRLLCEWWESARPAGEPFRPGCAMPLVRVRDDGEYWWGDSEIPNVSISEFNPSGRDVARIGNHMLVLFQATQEAATFDQHGMHTMLPSGESFNTIGIMKEEFLTGEWDEAWSCLNALTSFRFRFSAAWDYLNKTGYEYQRARRAEVAKEVPLPEGTRACPTCHGMPVLTEDPTGESRWRFQLKCGDHTTIGGDTIEEVIQDWYDDPMPPDDPPDN